jgi:hypothetical protein
VITITLTSQIGYGKLLVTLEAQENGHARILREYEAPKDSIKEFFGAEGSSP